MNTFQENPPPERSPGEWLTVLDTDGTPVIKGALLATLYFADGHQPAVRAAVAGCFEHFQAEVGGRLRWAKHPQTLAWHPVGSPAALTPRRWLEQVPANWRAGWERRTGNNT